MTVGQTGQYLTAQQIIGRVLTKEPIKEVTFVGPMLLLEDEAELKGPTNLSPVTHQFIERFITGYCNDYGLQCPIFNY